MGILILLGIVVLFVIVSNINKNDSRTQTKEYNNTYSKAVYTNPVSAPTSSRNISKPIITSYFKSYSSSEYKQFILDAIRKGNSIEIKYTAYSGEDTERRISPMEIVWFNQSECIKAFCYKRNEERNFKISRIRQMRMK
ncbi:MAG: WYL domain-containing protein [Marinifilaceae bacterium]